MTSFDKFVNDNLSEGNKITLKRQYTENHPAITVGKAARVRNKMLEAIADGKITQEEFNNILKEYSKDSGKWMQRNAKFFNVSEEGITLSSFGKRALKQITVNEGILFEGQFSWFTQDTERQIGSEKENTLKAVYMFDNKGNSWKESNYAGYGEFGGKDYYELLDQMNGGEGDRQAGIDLAFDDKKVKAGKVLFPALVEDPRFNWKRHDFTQEAESDPNQSWYQEPEYDEEYWDESVEVEEGRAFVAAAKKAKEEGKEEFEFDGNKFPVTIKEGNAFIYAAAKAKKEGKKDFEFNGKKYKVTLKADTNLKENKSETKMKNNFVFESFSAFVESLNESTLFEATVMMDAMNPDDKDFLKFLKKHKVTIIDRTEDGPSGYPEITMQGKRKDLEAVLSDEDYGWGDPDLAEYIEESVAINEAFKSSKLASILTGAGSMPKDLPQAFYGMAKIALDQIEDADIIEMDPQTARKEKRNSAVYLYFTTNEKPNPYAGDSSWGVKTIPGNTLLAMTNGKNEWMNTQWASKWSSKDRSRTLGVTDRDSSAGYEKGGTQDKWRSGISALSKVAELADRAYVLDLDILRARYSTATKRNERAAAKSGATAFKSDKDFKTENMARYHTILADRAAQMPIDEEVKKAIDMVAQQIKDGLAANKSGRYGNILIGTDPKGKEVTMKDASNVMSNLLDDFGRYVEYTNNAKKEADAGYGGDYYSREVKNYAKSIKDRIKKIENLDYAW